MVVVDLLFFRSCSSHPEEVVVDGVGSGAESPSVLVDVDVRLRVDLLREPLGLPKCPEDLRSWRMRSLPDFVYREPGGGRGGGCDIGCAVVFERATGRPGCVVRLGVGVTVSRVGRRYVAAMVSN